MLPLDSLNADKQTGSKQFDEIAIDVWVHRTEIRAHIESDTCHGS